MSAHRLAAELPATYAGKRLDQALAAMFPAFSRSRLQQWVEQGCVVVDGRRPRCADKVKGGERVELHVPQVPATRWQAQAIALDIVHEDDELLVVNKPAGLVVHPGAGNPDGTLLNALLHHAPGLHAVARAGIVHRLDKGTSGLLAVAKTERARLALVAALQARTVRREYLALVNGAMVAGGTIEAPIARHPRQRTRMAVGARGKPALSHYRVQRRYRAHTLLQVTLASGRTHQIRVHLAHIGYPVTGDAVYGGRLRLPPGASERLRAALHALRRPALHAARLALVHPSTGERLEWTAPVPEDMQALIEALEEDASPSPRPSPLSPSLPRKGGGSPPPQPSPARGGRVKNHK